MKKLRLDVFTYWCFTMSQLSVITGLLIAKHEWVFILTSGLWLLMAFVVLLYPAFKRKNHENH